MKENLTCIKRASTWYRPYQVQVGNNEFEVKKIVFFKDGEICCSIERGWLEFFPDNLSVYTEDIGQVWVKPVLKANKIKLDRVDNFFCGGTLYLYVDGANIKFVNSLEKRINTSDKYQTVYRYVQLIRLCTSPDNTFKDFPIPVKYEVEYTAHKVYVDELEKKLKSQGIVIDTYSLRLLLEKYDITAKKEAI